MSPTPAQMGTTMVSPAISRETVAGLRTSSDGSRGTSTVAIGLQSFRSVGACHPGNGGVFQISTGGEGFDTYRDGRNTNLTGLSQKRGCFRICNIACIHGVKSRPQVNKAARLERPTPTPCRYELQGRGVTN